MMNPTSKGSWSALLAVAALLTIGATRHYKVYDQDTEDFGIKTFHRVSDREVVIDATFSGIARVGTTLYSTYDRTQVRGKRACPT